MGFLEAVEDLIWSDPVNTCESAGLFLLLPLLFSFLAYAGAVEIDAGKEALGAGVAEQLGVHLPVGGSCAGAAHRSGGCGGVSADFEFILEQILHAAVIDGNEDQIGGLTAELEAERTAFHADKHRRAPAMSGAAGDDALAVLCADKKGALLHAWNHRNTGGRTENVGGDGRVVGGHDLIEDGSGRVDAALQVFFRRARKSRGGEQEAETNADNGFFHFRVLSVPSARRRGCENRSEVFGPGNLERC